MVDLTPHPKMCEVCRSSRAFYCLHRVRKLTGQIWEQWLCAECYQAGVKPKKGPQDVAKT